LREEEEEEEGAREREREREIGREERTRGGAERRLLRITPRERRENRRISPRYLE
jgi:hypothetical protein